MSDQPYAVMHIAKLKSVGSIHGSSAHTARDNQPGNADSKKSPDNVRLLGKEGAKLADLVADRIGNNGGKKIRQSSNPAHRAVIALELLLTASPEYFRPDDPSTSGIWQVDRLAAWTERNSQWLNDHFGENAVLAELHLDESTPHIHAYIVPMNSKGHLSAKDFVGGRDKLSALQTDYAIAMEPLGLVRGIKGSKATSERIQDYYSSVNKAESSPLSREDLIAHSVDRQRQITRRKEAIKTAHRLADKIAELEQTIEAQKAIIAGFEGANKAREHKGEITLAKVAADLGLIQNEVSPSRWSNGEHDIKITGGRFHDFRTAKRGENVIDLVQQINDCSFVQAVAFLDENNWIGAGQAMALIAVQSMDLGNTEVNSETGTEVGQEAGKGTGEKRSLETFPDASKSSLTKADETRKQSGAPKRQSELE
jgi:hypothetical protein